LPKRAPIWLFFLATKSKFEKARKELEGEGAKVLGVTGDVTRKADCERAVKRPVSGFGSLDGVVNNAGIIQIGPIEHMSDEDFKSAIDLHIWGPLYLSRAAMPYLKKGRVGRIANIASFGGWWPFRTWHLTRRRSSALSVCRMRCGMKSPKMECA
jgi:NAD(P)-dependent dehydrogenase (short-subunit alcohol dehydrogenase family)